MTRRLPVPSVGAVRRSVIIAGITALGVAGWLVLQVIHLAHEANDRRTELGRASADRIDLRTDVDRISAALDKANQRLLKVGEPTVPIPAAVSDRPSAPSMWRLPTKTVAIPGPAGPSGVAGKPGPAGTGAPGAPGKPGAGGAAGQDSTIPGPAGNPGEPGGNGSQGAAGVDGAPGTDGASGMDGVDGRGVASVRIVACRLIVTLTDGTDLDAGGVPCATPDPEPTETPTEPSTEPTPTEENQP